MAFNGYTDLPAPEELREMLSVIPYSDRDTWVAVTKILGRCYPGREDVYAVVREWGSRYEGRKPADEEHERRDFFTPASASDVNVGFGAFVALARKHGWQPKPGIRQKSQDSTETVQPAAVTAPVPESEGGSAWEVRTYAMVSELASRVLRFVLYTPSDVARSDFLAHHSTELTLLPEGHRQVADLLGKFLRTHREYTLPAFISWAGEKNRGLTAEQVDTLTGGDMPETKERCEDVWKDLSMRSSALIAVQEAEEFRRRVMARPWTAGDEAAALFHALAPSSPREICGPDEIVALVEKEIRELRNPSLREKLFVPTEMALLDEATSGFRRGDVSILAAYSGIGKTWFGIEMACRAIFAHQKRRVLFISLEMDRQAIAARMFMRTEGVSEREMRDPSRPLQMQIENFSRKMKDSIVGVDDNKGKTVCQIEAEIARRAFTGGLDLVVVDYLQLIQMPEFKGEIWNRLVKIMDRLTQVATRYGCAILCLAQLSNPNKNGGVKRARNGQVRAPGLYDIADATAVVRNASLVLTIYSEDVSQHSSTLKLKVLKSRYGRLTEFWIARNHGGGFTESTVNPDTDTDNRVSGGQVRGGAA